jgi:hypothetical protein
MENALVNLGQDMIESILENLMFLKTKNMFSNLGYCGMKNTLKHLRHRVMKNIRKCSIAHHKEYFGKVSIVLTELCIRT